MVMLLFFLLADNSCMISRCLRIFFRPEMEDVSLEITESETYVLSLVHV